jgi:hypothetical protein
MKIAIASSIIIFAALAYIAVPALLLVATGDYQGASSLYGLQEDSGAVSFLLNLHSLIK